MGAATVQPVELQTQADRAEIEPEGDAVAFGEAPSPAAGGTGAGVAINGGHDVSHNGEHETASSYLHDWQSDGISSRPAELQALAVAVASGRTLGRGRRRVCLACCLQLT
mgnify:FL=1